MGWCDVAKIERTFYSCNTLDHFKHFKSWLLEMRCKDGMLDYIPREQHRKIMDLYYKAGEHIDSLLGELRK